jgi:hypothetical protein
VTRYDRFAIITRDAFADFLDRHANNKADSTEWTHFVVRHYGDSFLEEIRRCVVRLAINELPIHGDTEAAHEILRSWGFLLRSSTNSTIPHKLEIATIEMTPSEAVVLDTILRRYSESDKLTVDNAAEQQCLWNVECLIERHSDRPKWPSHEDAIADLSPDAT